MIDINYYKFCSECESDDIKHTSDGITDHNIVVDLVCNYCDHRWNDIINNVDISRYCNDSLNINFKHI